MNAKAIRSLITGLVVMALLAGAIYLYQDTRNNIKVSRQSSVSANSYVLGLDYSGLITKELIKKGDFVHKGDGLAYVKSSSLLADLTGNKIKKEDLTYPLSENREIIIQATQDGVIADVNYLSGSYVPANQNIFKITANQAPFVVSHYNLSRADFKRLSKSSRLQITLPNGRLVESPIQQIIVDNSTISAGPTVAVSILSYIDPDRNLLIGSPVTATLHLGEQTKLQRLLHYVKNL